LLLEEFDGIQIGMISSFMLCYYSGQLGLTGRYGFVELDSVSSSIILFFFLVRLTLHIKATQRGQFIQ
jgi:hypothetical protein